MSQVRLYLSRSLLSRLEIGVPQILLYPMQNHVVRALQRSLLAFARSGLRREVGVIEIGDWVVLVGGGVAVGVVGGVRGGGCGDGVAGVVVWGCVRVAILSCSSRSVGYSKFLGIKLARSSAAAWSGYIVLMGWFWLSAVADVSVARRLITPWGMDLKQWLAWALPWFRYLSSCSGFRCTWKWSFLLSQ